MANVCLFHRKDLRCHAQEFMNQVFFKQKEKKENGCYFKQFHLGCCDCDDETRSSPKKVKADEFFKTKSDEDIKNSLSELEKGESDAKALKKLLGHIETSDKKKKAKNKGDPGTTEGQGQGDSVKDMYKPMLPNARSSCYRLFYLIMICKGKKKEEQVTGDNGFLMSPKTPKKVCQPSD